MNEKENTILLIDDDSRNIFALSAVLRAKGFDVLSAPSAQEGIALLQKQKGIKVVLLDMMMPGMDGYQALSILKTEPDLAEIPVFAVTAQAMVGDRERCLEAGADEYISKPVDVDVLLSLLKAHKVES
ncbi:response regulator [Flavisolibacter nicotianae]|uniref:response regulator n=1 Tax=Flavisolibacter nicotianae TaxID=2364882 RepID=UPI000EB547E3|nr:response regulator [Flavisolibacter nicotianae]